LISWPTFWASTAAFWVSTSATPPPTVPKPRIATCTMNIPPVAAKRRGVSVYVSGLIGGPVDGRHGGLVQDPERADGTAVAVAAPGGQIGQVAVGQDAEAQLRQRHRHAQAPEEGRLPFDAQPGGRLVSG